MAFERYGVYTGLHIMTPEELRIYYEQTENKNIREYRIKTLNEFVKDWSVKYFFNYEFKWDLDKIEGVLPGFGNLRDHVSAFVNKDGYYFLLMQPYTHVDPTEFCKHNKISKYMRYWIGGFHNEQTYAIVISGDFLTYIEKHIEDFKYCKEWSKRPKSSMAYGNKYWEDNIVKISDIHRKKNNTKNQRMS